MAEINIGIDISKDHLDVHRLPGDERRRFDNSKAGHKALIRWIGDIPQRGSSKNLQGTTTAPWRGR